MSTASLMLPFEQSWIRQILSALRQYVRELQFANNTHEDNARISPTTDAPKIFRQEPWFHYRVPDVQ